jgi:beta-N-acetylhexosaminidase
VALATLAALATVDARANITATPGLTPGNEGITPTITPLVTPTLIPTATLPPALAAGLAVTATAEERAAFALDEQVETLLAGMSVADRVGQLFVVTFAGNDTSFESAIAELIYAYRVGGVVLTPENGNFTNEPGADTPRQVAILANRLQAIAYGILLPNEVALQPVPLQPWPPSNFVSLERELGVTPPDLPLLIGAYQMGNALPDTSLRRGFTPLPSQLAIGSAWNLDMAQNVGEIVGRELSAVGVNLLLGPNLDVVEQPRADAVGSLSVFSFGGNASWVGRMGRAYISGVHGGSSGSVATAAGHFPGQGDLDRLPEEEVATIQRNREDIMRVAVPPFVSVTQPLGAITDTALSDILMTSHMRFNALQAPAGRNVPMSLDPELAQFVDSTLGDWRARGGLLMTGPLGVPAIRRYYDPALQEFPARRVALDAFTAGHDLLYLSRFALDESWESQLNNIRVTIAFFQERYRGDADFAASVDDSVRRILRLKLRLYAAEGDAPAVDNAPGALAIPLSNVLVQESDLAVLPGEDAALDPAPAQVARDSITILSPDPATAVLPPAPQAGERIVIVTDSRLQRECSTCTAEAAVDPDALARIILSLYGPDATGQISPEQLTSITFSDLNQILPPSSDQAADGTPSALATATPALLLPTPTPTPEGTSADLNESPEQGAASSARADIVEELAQADWVIFAMLDLSANNPESSVVRRYLRQPVDTRANQRIVVMALNAPFFLDATEISKLSLYYGVYSKVEPFLESAVRALFRSTVPAGAPALNVPGTRFASLADRLAPNPALTIPLRLSLGDVPLVSNTTPPAAGAPVQDDGLGLAVVNVGETLHLEAGPVLDLYGHPVPDGVLVNFDAAFEGAELALTLEPAPTRNGIAQRDLTIDRSGALRIVARAGAATSGNPVTVNVIDPEPAATTIPLTVVVTVTPSLSAVVMPTVTTEPPPAGVGVGALPAKGEGRTTRVNVMTLLLSLLTMLITLSLLLLAQIRVLPRETLFKSLIWAVLVGLLAYVLYAAGWLPGSTLLAQTLNVFGAPLVVFLAMLLPLFWLQLRAQGR